MKINVNDEFVMTTVPGRTFTVLSVGETVLHVKDNASRNNHMINTNDFTNAVTSGLVMIVDKKEQVKEEEKVEEETSNFFSFDDM
jgi:hypothetical protein